MRRIVHDFHGEPGEVLRLDEAAAGDDPAAGQVRIRVLVRPIHPGDLLGIIGQANEPTGGRVPGHEGMGVVDALGNDVGTLAIGQRVAFYPVQGAWGEFVLADARFVVPLPDDVEDTAASLMLVNPLTMRMIMRAVFEGGGGQAGVDGPIIQTAAGSSVGKLITSAIRTHDAEVISLVRSEAGALDFAERFPGTPVVSTSDTDWREVVRKQVDDRPVRAVVDAVGGELPMELLGLLTPGGSLIEYGSLSGQAMTVPTLDLVGREIVVRGVSVGRWAGLPDPVRAADTEFALELARSQPELLEVAAEFDLADFRQALEHAQRPGRVGTVLLTSREHAGN
ncbi:NADPH:quinone reductase-like Zn-dependent oxidoreductase [Promicromonospora sp. AC04]|uniref:zinc-binding dehydrogenase n=1 Tax=Promicromonospora sp. AC04 TaxID=2135723 RepID=UPI000D3D945F|nr:zinc-binding dehydrogenase [Promicromonospora sp. AC04]PUB20797.1 NADPH:quinone reductase-like Zn-dependent oxidoreductase [Promicromonospora sp. AC04]